MRRLQIVLSKNRFTRWFWTKEDRHIYRLGRARINFLSGSPSSNIVGATASILLACDEAQDVLPNKWDKEINPMAAAYNTTRVFWGTAWTPHTLLGRELRLSREQERQDHQRRVFTVNGEEVAQEVPAYRKFLAEQVHRLGRSHPLIRTQFFNEELQHEGVFFSADLLALMQGSHPARSGPEPGRIYAFLVDVGGEESYDSNEYANNDPQPNNTSDVATENKRDSTALTIVEVDPAVRNDQLAVYKVVHRHVWTGVQHTELFESIQALTNHWRCHLVVVDSTGIGAGLASFLEKALGKGRVVKFTFTAASKSELGWQFLGMIQTGRYKEFQPVITNLSNQVRYQHLFWTQARACEAEVVPGPQRLLRWGVPDNARSIEDQCLIHDDLLISAAMCAVLDRHNWSTGLSSIIQGQDILDGMKPVY